MQWILLYSATLFVAALISERAQRTILSTAVLFLLAGVVAGAWILPMRSGQTGTLIYTLSDLALFSVLFTDGMRLTLRQPAGAWSGPARALIVGLPVVVTLGGLFAHFLGGLRWSEAFLVGAILSPTDPVFASAIIGREWIPWRLKRLLNVESGLNDGLALPLVFVLLDLTRGEASHPWLLAGELAGGVALGVMLPLATVLIQRLRVFSASPEYEALDIFAVGGLLYASSALLAVNSYLAAFSGGVVIRYFAPQLVKGFSDFGDRIAELLKLAALFVFGAVLGHRGLPQGALTTLGFSILMIAVARPVSILLALAWSDVPWPERLVAAWFGPKGFASVVFGLIALRAGLPDPTAVFALLASTVAVSIVAHSSTDVPIARLFQQQSSSHPAPE